MTTRFAGLFIALAAAGMAGGAWLLYPNTPSPPPSLPPRAPALPHRVGAETLPARPATQPQALRQPQAPTGTAALVLRAPWGDAPGSLGHRRPTEGAPEGPMSFVVDERGRLHILDQVNERIQVFDGPNAVGATPLPRPSFQDIALDGHGGWIVLDRLRSPAVVYLAKDGAAREVALVGDGVREGGAVTALFARSDGAWVEVEHAELVHITDSAGGADTTRPRVQGRFAGDGASIRRVSLAGRDSISVLAQDAAVKRLAPTRATQLSFADPILHIETVESDDAGRTIVVAGLVRRNGSGGPTEVLEAAVLDAQGNDVGRFRMMPRRGPEEQFRAVRLGGDGALYQLVCDDEGATVWRFNP